MNELEQLYQQVIMDHARERHGSGRLTNPDGESFQVNPTCGDQTTVQLVLSQEGGEPRISALAWDGVGCAISQASLSLMSDLTSGGSVAEAEHLGEVFREMMHSRGDFPAEKLDLLGDASALVGVSRYSARVKCALLGWMALRAALTEALGARQSGNAQPTRPSEQPTHPTKEEN